MASGNNAPGPSSAVDTLCPEAQCEWRSYQPQLMYPPPPLMPPVDFQFMTHYLVSPHLSKADASNLPPKELVMQELERYVAQQPNVELTAEEARMPVEQLLEDDAAIDAIVERIRASRIAPGSTLASTSAQSDDNNESSTRAPEDTSCDDDMMRLLRRAGDAQLQMHESTALVECLKSDDGVTVIEDAEVQMSPALFARIIEFNPAVAVQVFLLRQYSHDAHAYYHKLLNSELSVHLMEVVNRLTQTPSARIPTAFLQMYVERCMRACEQKHTNDANPATVNRLVRMVCVFLSSLIRSKRIDKMMDDLYVEMQQFCTAHSNVREAAQLYQTIVQNNTDKQTSSQQD